MKTKIIQTIPFFIFFALLIFVHFLYSCADTLTCSLRGIVWNNTFTILDPAFVFSQLAIIPSILTVFFQKKVFISWLKFAAWAIPPCIIFIAITPVSSTAVMNFFPFYRDDAARLAGEVFAAISLIIIICCALRSARAK